MTDKDKYSDAQIALSFMRAVTAVSKDALAVAECALSTAAVQRSKGVLSKLQEFRRAVKALEKNP